MIIYITLLFKNNRVGAYIQRHRMWTISYRAPNWASFKWAQQLLKWGSLHFKLVPLSPILLKVLSHSLLLPPSPKNIHFEFGTNFNIKLIN